MNNVEPSREIAKRDYSEKTVVEPSEIPRRAVAVSHAVGWPVLFALGILLFVIGFSHMAVALIVLAGVPVGLGAMGMVGHGPMAIASPTTKFNRALETWAQDTERWVDSRNRDRRYSKGWDSVNALTGAEVAEAARKSLTPEVKRDLMLRKPVEVVLPSLDTTPVKRFEDTREYNSYLIWKEMLRRKRGYVYSDDIEGEILRKQKMVELKQAQKDWEDSQRLRQTTRHSRLRFDGQSIAQVSWTEVNPEREWLDAVDNALEMK